MPQSLATRARIVLLAAEGESNTRIAEPLGLSLPTVGIWQKRYRTQRIRGLYDEPRPGGPRSIRDEEIALVEEVTHDYVRHGTTTLFAALDVASGRVITQYKHRHRHQEFLTFLRHIEESVPNELDVHLIVETYATRKHESICRWLAARPRFQVHSTPTYSSWLNQVEIWFNIITQRAIRRGTFPSVRDFVEKIETFVKHYNRRFYPFAWTATPGSILQKLERLGKPIAGTRH